MAALWLLKPGCCVGTCQQHPGGGMQLCTGSGISCRSVLFSGTQLSGLSYGVIQGVAGHDECSSPPFCPWPLGLGQFGSSECTIMHPRQLGLSQLVKPVQYPWGDGGFKL